MTSPVARLAAAMLAGRPSDAAILQAPAGSAAIGHLGSLIGADRVFGHTDWCGHPPPDSIHVELAETDADLPVQRTALWPGGRVPLLRRVRRIDTLHAGLGGRPIGLIGLHAAADPFGVLRGAERVLAQTTPAILLDTRGHADGVALAAQLAAQLAGLVWLEMATGVFCGVDPRNPPLRVAPDDTPSQGAAFDPWLICEGLHQPEWDAPHGGRWTGLSTTTWFMLPRPDPGTWLLRLDIADWGNLAEAFPISLDGAPLPVSIDTQAALVAGPVDIDEGPEPMRVRLYLPRAVPDLDRWPRKIGLRILRAGWVPMP